MTGSSHKRPLTLHPTPPPFTHTQDLLAKVGDFYSKAGGSAANTTRALAGFGVRTQMLGTRGQDEWGTLFISSMKRAQASRGA